MERADIVGGLDHLLLACLGGHSHISHQRIYRDLKRYTDQSDTLGRQKERNVDYVLNGVLAPELVDGLIDRADHGGVGKAARSSAYTRYLNTLVD